jgi:hypothetical protein
MNPVHDLTPYRPLIPRHEHFSVAVTLLEQQAEVPISPCEPSGEGRLLLCAGAALMAVAIKAEISQDAQESFLNGIRTPSGRAFCLKVADKLGWGTWLPRILLKNDEASPHVRKPYVAGLLRDLAGSVCAPIVADPA